MRRINLPVFLALTSLSTYIYADFNSPASAGNPPDSIEEDSSIQNTPYNTAPTLAPAPQTDLNQPAPSTQQPNAPAAQQPSAMNQEKTTSTVVSSCPNSSEPTQKNDTQTTPDTEAQVNSQGASSEENHPETLPSTQPEDVGTAPNQSS